MKWALGTILALLLGAGGAAADAPEASRLPQARPVPASSAQAQARLTVRPATGASVLAVVAALLPSPRPARVTERVEQASAQAARGQLCGTPAIQGDRVAPVQGGGGCGIEEPVQVRLIDGVRLSEPALMDCVTAEALLHWVREGARPAVGGRGGGLAGFRVAGSYVCRSRNGQSGAKLSEHGLGRAIDIAGVLLADGSELAVGRDWPDPALTGMHRAACGIFSTTLGPGSDGYHEDHLHFDTARGRGAYCR